MNTTTTIGQTVSVDGWNWPVTLKDADGYEGAEYRVTLPGAGVSVPVRVTITGRLVRWEAPIVGGGVRVALEILHDDDEPTVVRGWMSWRELEVGNVSLNPRGL